MPHLKDSSYAPRENYWVFQKIKVYNEGEWSTTASFTYSSFIISFIERSFLLFRIGSMETNKVPSLQTLPCPYSGRPPPDRGPPPIVHKGKRPLSFKSWSVDKINTLITGPSTPTPLVSRGHPGSYRPVSLISEPGKLIETIKNRIRHSWAPFVREAPQFL